MMRFFPLSSFCALLLSLAIPASAQSLRIRSAAPPIAPEESPWSGFLRYSVMTDYAEPETPRGVTQSLRSEVDYKLDDSWTLSTDLRVRAVTYNGQIEKGREQTYDETLNPSTAFELDYGQNFWQSHSYALFVHGEPLWDRPSRDEGYKGIMGAGASLSLGFFAKRLIIQNVIDISELINTFRYSLDTTANPDMFYTYRLVTSVRLFAQVRLSAAFGVKLTRYTDAYTGYEYENTLSLSTSYHHWVAALNYENGGFTDNGELSLWYIDQYRRVGMLTLGYQF